MKILFTKLQGCGNDFVLLDSLPGTGNVTLFGDLNPDQVKRICDRRFGIGCDQLLWMKAPQVDTSCDARMEIRNADGSSADMCGNGVRAAALYLFKKGPKAGQKAFRIETAAGVQEIQVQGDGHMFAVDMPEPKGGDAHAGSQIAFEKVPLDLGGRSTSFVFVDTGVPHTMLFVDDVTKVEIETLGPKVEKNARFKDGTNVDFVQVKGPKEIKVRFWERGAGATLACGTGACASAVAAIATGRTESPTKVVMPGGEIIIEWAGPGNKVVMTGPASEVFSGQIEL